MIEALYNQRIKELAAAACGAGRLDAPSGSAMRDSPVCGDRVRMEVRVADGRIVALAHEVKGCLLCRAAASVIGLHGVGLSAADSEALRAGVAAMLAGGERPDGWTELAVFEPVRQHRSRHGCVLIPFEALAKAVAEG
ncbi:iron-sulfur cluster assembly scaffold protein [Aromatoleum aromaticum]|uniref:Possible NifU homolog n=1 Tax=Aromatoleum aromaticum (strain DSM 19018 / LMG 30748 / EbN1) TaxID=76114 RepID=Q5P5Y4_AROAE|nr:iron-sulfur cluster assembly scaffold protein [Aromatoleum aromaticum]NMG54309.1 iron-sulfur cluster assembly scaffold protein [Aromatoleum aromaticum]CAI07277.1 Possible NifU homolog [Aromatoleum aromaticum EbN1]